MTIFSLVLAACLAYIARVQRHNSFVARACAVLAQVLVSLVFSHLLILGPQERLVFIGAVVGIINLGWALDLIMRTLSVVVPARLR